MLTTKILLESAVDGQSVAPASSSGSGISAPLVYLLFIGFFILLALVIFVIMRQNQLNARYRSFFRGGKGRNLEEAIKTRLNDIDKIRENEEFLQTRVDTLEKSKSSGFKKHGIVKYDAFRDMGGKLSFAYALLDDDNNGFIFNSIHSREGCYTYIKEIIKGESYIDLSEEENEALSIAMQTNAATLK